jgi:hypothetical protein
LKQPITYNSTSSFTIGNGCTGHWRKSLKPAVDYKAIVDELRRRLLDSDKRIEGKVLFRLAGMLDTDPNAPMDVVIAKLDEKWRRDGLIQEHND